MTRQEFFSGGPRMGFFRSLYADLLILLLGALERGYQELQRDQMRNLRQRDRIISELVRVTKFPESENRLDKILGTRRSLS
jgi:hypothetical protein